MKQAKISRLATGLFASVVLVAACAGGGAQPTTAPASDAPASGASTVPTGVAP